MAVQSGIVQYCDYGVGAACTASLGIVTGGEIGPGVASIVHREGIGGQAQIQGGLVEIAGSIDFLPTDTACLTFINSVIRSAYTSPALSALAIESGSTGGYGYLHTGCKLDTVRLSQSVGEALSASVSWFGTAVTPDSSPTPQTKATGLTFEWFQSTVTIDGQTYDVLSFDVEVGNSLEPYSSLDSKAAASKRLPEGIKIGSEVVTCSLVLQAEATSLDLDADAIDKDIDVVIAATNATITETITLSDLSPNSAQMSFASPDGIVTWALELEGKRNNSGTVALAAS